MILIALRLSDITLIQLDRLSFAACWWQWRETSLSKWNEVNERSRSIDWQRLSFTDRRDECSSPLIISENNRTEIINNELDENLAVLNSSRQVIDNGHEREDFSDGNGVRVKLFNTLAGFHSRLMEFIRLPTDENDLWTSSFAWTEDPHQLDGHWSTCQRVSLPTNLFTHAGCVWLKTGLVVLFRWNNTKRSIQTLRRTATVTDQKILSLGVSALLLAEDRPLTREMRLENLLEGRIDSENQRSLHRVTTRSSDWNTPVLMHQSMKTLFFLLMEFRQVSTIT